MAINFKVGDLVRISDFALVYQGIARQAYLQLYQRGYVYEITGITQNAVEIREYNKDKESGLLSKNVVTPEFLTRVESSSMYTHIVKNNLNNLYDGIRCLDNKIQSNIYECIKLMDDFKEESLKQLLDNLKECCKLAESLDEEDEDFITSEIASIIKTAKKIKFQETEKKDNVTLKANVKYNTTVTASTIFPSTSIPNWDISA